MHIYKSLGRHFFRPWKALLGAFNSTALDHSKLDLEVILHDYMDEWGGESVTDTGHINWRCVLGVQTADDVAVDLSQVGWPMLCTTPQWENSTQLAPPGTGPRGVLGSNFCAFSMAPYEFSLRSASRRWRPGMPTQVWWKRLALIPLRSLKYSKDRAACSSVSVQRSWLVKSLVAAQNILCLAIWGLFWRNF